MTVVTARDATGLGERYARALRQFLAGDGEVGLTKAYELGREAIEDGLGVLELVVLHQGALAAALRSASTPGETTRATAEAHEFLLEGLSSFELVHSGFRDTNARLREANETLRRERATLAAVMASMSDGVVFVDSQGLIRYGNARARELIPGDLTTLVGERAETVFGRMGLAPDVLDSALSEGWEPSSFEVTSAGPPRRDLLVHLFPVADVDGADSGVGAIVRDVTAERELVRAKDEIVSIVSHELRTPLASILGFAELLSTRRVDDATQRRHLSLIASESRRLAEIINRFLNVQRIEAGVLTLAPFDLHELLRARVELYSGQSDRHALTLERTDEPLDVVGDRDRIADVVGNLLSNAIKYSPAGGAVTVEARAIGKRVRVSVTDSGLGIPENQRDRLFTKFFRVVSPDRAEIGGTGLGLALCRQIVEAHGGRIGFESFHGTGSTFWFELPLRAATPIQDEDRALTADTAVEGALLAVVNAAD